MPRVTRNCCRTECAAARHARQRTAMMLSMWVCLETWTVKDGALPELARASRLRGVGLRAGCHAVGPAWTATDGIAELADPGGEQGSGSYRYELTGLAGHAADVRSERGHAGSEFVVTTG